MTNTILAFTALWCGPCKSLKPTLKELPEGSVIFYDIEDYPDMVTQYNVTAVPTLIALNQEGAEVKRLTGNAPLRVIVEQLLNV